MGALKHHYFETIAANTQADEFDPQPKITPPTRITVEVLAKEQYGNFRFYPANPSAHLFATLTGTSTLTERHLQIIKRLGCRVTIQRTHMGINDFEE